MSPAPANARPRANVGGVALYYERRASTDRWGDLAKDEAFAPSFVSPFYETLSGSFAELWPILGTPTGIISGGAYVEKPGAHGLGRGFDLDGIIWPGRKWNATEWKSDEAKRFYLGLQAHFLRSFGNVLGYLYNAAHADHFHLDDLVPPGFRSNSRAIVTFVQEALRVVHGIPVLVDGDWGPATARALCNVLRVEQKAFPNGNEWRHFLERTRTLALASGGEVAHAPTSRTLEQRVELLERAVADLQSNA